MLFSPFKSAVSDRSSSESPSAWINRKRAVVGALLLMIVSSLTVCAPVAAADRFIVMASTTSTEQSGLFEHLLPAFTAQTGIAVRVVAQGTGQALATARRGDADLVFVHDRPAEDAFVAEGHGLVRRDVMYNDFILVGPRTDPAAIAGLRDAAQALQRIAAARSPFVSRGDRSGTHAAERRLWKDAGIDIDTARVGWYREAGAGMGPTLNIASGIGAYILADRGTWLNFRNRADLRVLVEGDPRLFNQYGVIVVNPVRHPHVRLALAQRFADWIVSPAGQQVIAAHRIDGEQSFFPNASR